MRSLLGSVDSARSSRSKMLKRTITGACYVAIIVAFFLLRELVDARLFNILNWFFIAVGTFELGRMLKPFVLKGTFTASLVYGIIFAPLYCIIEYFVFSGLGGYFALGLCSLFIIAFCVYSLIKKANAKTFVVSLLPFIYPALLLLTSMLVNDIVAYGFIALLLIFVIAPCADTMAYLVGMTYNKIRKGNARKLCPKLSPKKTVAGAIGGLIGGMLGAIIIYLIVKPKVAFFSPVLLFAIIGLVASLLTEIGDLFESFIKRKAGVKDSGKIMPGHGGILDRVDGMMFSSVFVYLVFLLI